MSVAPGPVDAPVRFENVRALVSNIPTFAVFHEAHIRFPLGKRHPPMKEPPQATLLELNTFTQTIFPPWAGSPITLPFGASTTDWIFEVPVKTFVKFPPKGLATHDVLYTAEFAPWPPKNTFPFGKRTAPARFDHIGPRFEYERVKGFTSPMFPERTGAMTTLPVGVRTPPWNDEPVGTFEYAPVRGFRMTTFELEGTRTTFPFGVRTPPRNPDGPNFVVEKRPVTGLKKPRFPPELGINRTRPSGKSRFPNQDPEVAPTFPNAGLAEVAHHDRTG